MAVADVSVYVYPTHPIDVQYGSFLIFRRPIIDLYVFCWEPCCVGSGMLIIYIIRRTFGLRTLSLYIGAVQLPMHAQGSFCRCGRSRQWHHVPAVLPLRISQFGTHDNLIVSLIEYVILIVI